ncbi:MAG TPA: hypothetical protein PKI34_06215 [Bacteroidales bacterium]|nr:hypothetical protein [Bacteroidales bacterium]
MKNCLIMGSGRSGTSLMGGLLYNAGYYMGEELYAPLESNPKGFFECAEINGINEDILAKYNVRPDRNFYYSVFPRSRNKFPVRDQRWLTSVPPAVTITCEDASIEERIQSALRKEPFCFKDPRFSYTYPVWEKFLPQGTRFICVFREPDVTVQSILDACARHEYLGDLYITRKSAFRLLYNLYSHILSNFTGRMDILYVHYRQLLSGDILPKTEDFLDCDLQKDWIDEKLNRTVASGRVPARTVSVYRRLCELANYLPLGTDPD